MAPIQTSPDLDILQPFCLLVMCSSLAGKFACSPTCSCFGPPPQAVVYYGKVGCRYVEEGPTKTRYAVNESWRFDVKERKWEQVQTEVPKPRVPQTPYP